MLIFLIIGVLGIAAGGWFVALFAPSAEDWQALRVAAGVGGLLSLIYGVALGFLVFERRGGRRDRRGRASAIHFEDRRTGGERRGAEPAASAHAAGGESIPLSRRPRAV